MCAGGERNRESESSDHAHKGTRLRSSQQKGRESRREGSRDLGNIESNVENEILQKKMVGFRMKKSIKLVEESIKEKPLLDTCLVCPVPYPPLFFGLAALFSL